MVKIYVMTHKKCDSPRDNMYVLMQVGKAIHESLGYLSDDTYDNISNLNPFFSELTGMYWIWKNDKESDIVGLCHYRRYLLDDNNKLFTGKEIEKLLGDFDIITTKLLTLNYSYYEGFSANHNRRDLDIVENIIRIHYPMYYDIYISCVNDIHTYFGNMIICSKRVFDSYCKWLFDILFLTMKEVDMTGYDDYQKRLYGFISEILLLVYIKYNNLTVKECKVAMFGEKKETIEMKDRLERFFREKDMAGAKEYFMDCLSKRPDVLMEASDINGELKTCMQLIITAQYEQEIYDSSGNNKCYLDECNDLRILIPLYQRLNDVMERNLNNKPQQEDAGFLAANNFSQTALGIAREVVRAKKRISI